MLGSCVTTTNTVAAAAVPMAIDVLLLTFFPKRSPDIAPISLNSAEVLLRIHSVFDAVSWVTGRVSIRRVKSSCQ